jgi:hypothetical protein
MTSKRMLLTVLVLFGTVSMVFGGGAQPAGGGGANPPGQNDPVLGQPHQWWGYQF